MVCPTGRSGGNLTAAPPRLASRGALGSWAPTQAKDSVTAHTTASRRTRQRHGAHDSVTAHTIASRSSSRLRPGSRRGGGSDTRRRAAASRLFEVDRGGAGRAALGRPPSPARVASESYPSQEPIRVDCSRTARGSRRRRRRGTGRTAPRRPRSGRSHRRRRCRRRGTSRAGRRRRPSGAPAPGKRRGAGPDRSRGALPARCCAPGSLRRSGRMSAAATDGMAGCELRCCAGAAWPRSRLDERKGTRCAIGCTRLECRRRCR